MHSSWLLCWAVPGQLIPETVDTDADLYVFSLKDTVLADVIARVRPNEGLWVHTAGSMPMDVFNGHTANYGVLYPMQTFSKTREVDFNVIPFFLEANTSENAGKLQHLAEKLSGNIRFLSSDKRKSLHLAAVFACNFTNHIYALAVKLLEEQDIPADVLIATYRRDGSQDTYDAAEGGTDWSGYPI